MNEEDIINNLNSKIKELFIELDYIRTQKPSSEYFPVEWKETELMKIRGYWGNEEEWDNLYWFEDKKDSLTFCFQDGDSYLASIGIRKDCSIYRNGHSSVSTAGTEFKFFLVANYENIINDFKNRIKKEKEEIAAEKKQRENEKRDREEKLTFLAEKYLA